MAPAAKGRQSQLRLKVLLPFVTAAALAAWTVMVSYIPSSSMEPGLKPGDTILAERAWIAYPFGAMPKHGDVILFRLTDEQLQRAESPDGSTADEPTSTQPDSGLALLHDLRRNILIKRVIGLPGDTVLLQGNQVIVNGHVLEEHYPTIPIANDTLEDYNYGSDQPYKVPPGEIFVLGDNRDVSEDSRYWGTVHRNEVLARYICKLFHRTPPRRSMQHGTPAP